MERSFVRPTTSRIPSRHRRGAANGSSRWSQPRPGSDRPTCLAKSDARASRNLNRVADADDTGLGDACPDTERERLTRRLFGAVLPECRKGVQIRHAGPRVECGDRAAADIPTRYDHGRSDVYATADPRVLGVRVDARDAEEHAKATRIDRSGHARGLRDRAKRFFREERRTGTFIGAIDTLAGIIEAHEPHRPPRPCG